MSLCGDKYETQEEVEFRLKGTVVMYDGRPVYITKCSFPENEDGKEIARVYFHELPLNGGAPIRKFLSSKKFDLTPIKLGYMNYKGQAIFLSRNPVRQNKQGLCDQTCIITDVRGKPVEAGKRAVLSTLISHKEFVDMVDGKYPNFRDIGGLLDNKDTTSVAVSRSFAFQLDHDLEALLLVHRGVKCGIALKGEKHLRLPPKFHFLKQEAEECRIPLA